MFLGICAAQIILNYTVHMCHISPGNMFNMFKAFMSYHVIAAGKKKKNSI